MTTQLNDGGILRSLVLPDMHKIWISGLVRDSSHPNYGERIALEMSNVLDRLRSSPALRLGIAEGHHGKVLNRCWPAGSGPTVAWGRRYLMPRCFLMAS